MNVPLRIYLHRPSAFHTIFIENLKRMEEPCEEVSDPLDADIIVVSNRHYIGEIWRETVFVAVVGCNPSTSVPENVVYVTTFQACEKFIGVVKCLLEQHIYS